MKRRYEKEPKVPKEAKQYDTLPWYSEEERKVFDEIDRGQENKDVDLFQKTKDMALFEKVYKNRIPTLQIWARRYAYLKQGSKEDMMGELNYYFTKATLHYELKRSSFNTCLFTYIMYGIRNMQIGRRAKKRLPEGMNPDCITNFLLSLDYSYDGKDGTGNTLADVVSAQLSTKEEIIDSIHLGDTLKIMANGDPQIMGWLRKLSDGSTIASLIKECKTRNGKIHIDKSLSEKIDGKKQTKKVSLLIKSKADIQGSFRLVDYWISSGDLHYTIEMRKTKEADLVMKTIRRLRKDKASILNKIEA